MSTRTKSAVVVSALALVALTLWLLTEPWEVHSADQAEAPRETGSSRHSAEAAQERESAPSNVDRTQVETTPRDSIPAPTTGTLIIKATYESDQSPASDLVVMAGPPGADHRVSFPRRTTDAEGFARFEGMRPGKTWVRNVRNFKFLRATVTAGVETDVELVLPRGATATGVVVDKDGVPISGAEIYVSSMGQADRDVERVGHTDAEGRFRIPSFPTHCLIGARADGHAPARMQYLFLKNGGNKEFRFVLADPGGTVAGVVRTTEGSPVGGAVVRVGAGQTSSVAGGSGGSVPPPALVHTDAEGNFRAVGLAVGEHPIGVRGFGLAPWRGNCQVAAGVTTTLEITLQDGVTCTGVVVDTAGTPMAKATVEVGSWDDLAHYRTSTATDGTFRMVGLPDGEVELRAELHDHGEATSKLRGNPGETVTCRLVLDRGLELRGRILTTGNTPVERASVEASTKPERGAENWFQFASSDAEGAFAITNCPVGRPLTVTVRGRGVRPKRLDDVDPRAGPIEIVVDSAPRASARIVGKLVKPDGSPAANAQVSATSREGNRSGMQAVSEQGMFELGPVVPGDWRVTIRAEGLPPIKTEMRTVTADEKSDLGTIWLVAGGTVRVELRKPADLKPRMSLLDAGSNWSGLRGDGGVLRSDPVAPGLCHISVFGDGVGSQFVPVRVRSGEETKVIVSIEAGHRQKFRFSAPKVLSVRRVLISRGSSVFADVTYRARLDWALPLEFERWLTPGDYEVTVTGDSFSGQARFTVGAGQNDPVHVVLK